MGDRKGDVRVYVICCFFFACTIGGGIFLCIYIFLPDSEAVPEYLFAGMTLVAIPWLSWFLIFIYRCIRPIKSDEQYNNNHGGNNNNAAIWTPNPSQTPVPPAVTSPSGAKSPVHSPGGGERHVQFGAVVEMGNGLGGGSEEHHHNEDFVQHYESREEQERPTLVMVQQ